jgi:AcrR family transcriptional regulator
VIQRKNADKTRKAILKFSQKLFAENGFSGTSTLAIAKAAKINEALIFHHFGNKEKLWQHVKAVLVESLAIEPFNPTPESLRLFLTTAINQRLDAYSKKPELVRLLQWQQMEKKQAQLFAGNLLAPNNWLPAIEYLQKNKKINPNVPPKFIMIWLVSSINTLIFDHLKMFHDDIKRQQYIEFLISGFELALLSPAMSIS